MNSSDESYNYDTAIRLLRKDGVTMLKLALLSVESGGMSRESDPRPPTKSKEREHPKGECIRRLRASQRAVALAFRYLRTRRAFPGAGTQPKVASEQDIQLLREDIRAQRRQITASNMTLTPGEATKSWPIYDQYIQETIKINDDHWAMIKDYPQTTTP